MVHHAWNCARSAMEIGAGQEIYKIPDKPPKRPPYVNPKTNQDSKHICWCAQTKRGNDLDQAAEL